MKNYKIVLLKWKACSYMLKASIFFWFTETIYFLYTYGWHLKAINSNEQLCDEIYYYGVAVSFFLFISVLIDIVKYLLEQKK